MEHGILREQRFIHCFKDAGRNDLEINDCTKKKSVYTSSCLPKAYDSGSIIHLVHKYNIGHRTKGEMLTKNVNECLTEQ